MQDNLPNTVLESLACGKPVVAFRAAGLAAMIQDGVTGRLADPFSPASLAAALKAVIRSAPAGDFDSECRAEFERVYAWPGPAEKYCALYRELMELDRQDMH
jgi:glycosyltransferase involved in cell wall biosynthesis